MPRYEVQDASGIQPGQLHKRKSPYEQMMDEIRAQGTFFTYPEACRILNVSQPTLRKMVKGFDQPSKYVQWGKRHVWLFTEEDVEKIAERSRIVPKWE